MHLSLHSDYACRVLIFLAVSPQDLNSIDEIAVSFGISKNHLVKIVHQLGKKGFVETVRGRGGGLKLAKSPKDISIASVIREMEPHFDAVECMNAAKNTCPIISACGLKPWINKAMLAFLDTLDGVSVADVVRNRKGIQESLEIDG